MKVFSVSGYFVDDPDNTIDGYLIAEFNETPQGYRDEDIFFYGLSEKDIKEAIKTKEPVSDFIITSYEVER